MRTYDLVYQKSTKNSLQTLWYQSVQNYHFLRVYHKSTTRHFSGIKAAHSDGMCRLFVPFCRILGPLYGPETL